VCHGEVEFTSRFGWLNKRIRLTVHALPGMHAIQDRPVAVDGNVVVRPMMYVALSYDHRLVDGREAVTFLVQIKEMIEKPARLLLEV